MSKMVPGIPMNIIDKSYARADLYNMSNATYCQIFRTTL